MTMYKSVNLEYLRNNKDIFNLIPNSIGKVVWYSTTHLPEKSKYSNPWPWAILACSVILLSWCFLQHVSVYLPIIITVLGSLYIAHVLGKGSGADYIIGEKGFCIVKFKKFRQSISNVQAILFDDIKYVFSGETKIFEDKKYNRTEFTCSFYGKECGDVYPLLFTKSGSYVEDDCFKEIEHQFFPDYLFIKEIEEICSKQILKSSATQETVEFKAVETALHRNSILNKITDSIIKDKGIAYNKLSKKNLRNITLTSNQLIIDGVEYDLRCLQYAGIDKGFLVVEHENHKRRLLGFADKGDIHSIQLNGLSNMKAFIAMLQYRMSLPS